MEGRIKHALHVVVLMFYCSYAMSPIYLSAMAVRNDRIVERGQQEKNVTFGIVWVNVLLSKMIGADRSLPAAPAEVRTGGHEHEFILIKKKRAVLREAFQLRPLRVQLADVSISGGPPAMLSCTGETPRRSNFLHDDITISSHTGLPPPVRSA
ncbi:MAG: hypothetical protein HGB21_03065 [Nitrospirae bacterium]|nr:hypothetical protein [Nitrospirota bacterium]NTW65286.1 hypothetical protein [Nitrospirota bacterium]